LFNFPTVRFARSIPLRDVAGAQHPSLRSISLYAASPHPAECRRFPDDSLPQVGKSECAQAADAQKI